MLCSIPQKKIMYCWRRLRQTKIYHTYKCVAKKVVNCVQQTMVFKTLSDNPPACISMNWVEKKRRIPGKTTKYVGCGPIAYYANLKTVVLIMAWYVGNNTEQLMQTTQHNMYNNILFISSQQCLTPSKIIFTTLLPKIFFIQWNSQTKATVAIHVLAFVEN